MSDSIDVDYFIYTDIFFAENMCNVVAKEYKEEAQCAQNGERMLAFVICGRSFWQVLISYGKFIISKALKWGMLGLCTLIFQ